MAIPPITLGEAPSLLFRSEARKRGEVLEEGQPAPSPPARVGVVCKLPQTGSGPEPWPLKSFLAF